MTRTPRLPEPDDAASTRPLRREAAGRSDTQRAIELPSRMSTTRARSAAGRRIISVRHELSSAAIDIVAGGVATTAGAPAIAPLLSWAVAVMVLLTRVWRICWRIDSDGTERLAEAKDRSRSTDAWVLVAAVASLGAVVNALVRSSGDHDTTASHWSSSGSSP